MLNIPGATEATQLYYRPSDKCSNKCEDKKGHKPQDVCVGPTYVYEFYYIQANNLSEEDKYGKSNRDNLFNMFQVPTMCVTKTLPVA